VPALSQAAAPVGKKAKIQTGVQLYSVRKLCEKDLIGTLKAIKEMGYVGVEFAGYYGKTAKELKQILSDLGLVACGTHTGLDSIKPQNIAKTIEFNQEIGNKYLMVPGMNAKDAQGWIDFAKIFSDPQ
jgi:sugar phosphate isomerase/epimerase